MFQQKILYFIIYFLFLLPACLFAAPLPIIREVNYNGLNYISPLLANEIATIKIGEELKLIDVDQSILAFYQQGYFEDIWVTESNGILTFNFVEKPTIAKIEINGYGSGTDKEALYKEIGIKKGDFYDTGKLERAEQRIKSTLEQKGFYDTVIETETEKLNERALKLIINVNQGEEIIIRQARYNGSYALSASQIESVAANREAEWLGWMWGFNDGKLQMRELGTDAGRIKNYYMTKGFLDASVSAPILEADFDSYNAKLTYEIKEGEVYSVGSVSIDVDEEVILSTELMDTLYLTEGKRFNIETVRKDIERMREIIGDLGYAFVRIDPQLDSDRENAKVHITYKITLNEKVKIHRVIVAGNTRTLDRVIRREVTLSPGDLYKLSKVKTSRNNLRQLGFFEKVEIEEKRVNENQVDLLVQVTETRTGEFMFGVGYGSYDGFLGNISVRERNLFGSGMNAGIYIDKSQKEGNYRANLYNPRVLDSLYSLSTDVYKRDYITYDYTERGAGFSLTGGRRFFDHFHATVGYNYTLTELTNFYGGLEEIYRPYFYDRPYAKSSIVPGLSYDSTDDYYFPRNGLSISTFIEFAGVGGDEKFIKYFGRGAGYTNLDNFDGFDVIFRLKGRAGMIQEQGYLPINEKFYLGGVSSLRGYKSNSVTPFDANGVRIGGKYMAAGSAEMSFGLFETVQMRLTLFFDYGMIGQASFNEIQRYSTGAAIEWVSPLGPISFMFPYALNPQPGDKTSRFEFGMGTRF
ncbi:outer membrane protein assembly factor BamA [Helicobacter monodelphidis]|uniref:outer membrane protein assembly factor BamA n=1 Tax=Helicobacter sp. 15-1451 TaxID=2004995 RepID=UPI000DCC8D31|nr:outer membrane protein assembly factor BamA [Helicobacter sp. 15-1451]RAX58918.1 outer membrane protein assembly factor BamA [Helicobacter sp. 15-1451]